MKAPETKPTVKLIGEDGNAFYAYIILGKVKSALKQAGADKEYIDKYLEEAKAGDYNNLLVTTMKYVEIK